MYSCGDERFLIPASAEEAEQIEEEVDEVEIEGQGTDDGKFLRFIVHIVGCKHHLFDFLRIIGSEPEKRDDADDGWLRDVPETEKQ